MPMSSMTEIQYLHIEASEKGPRTSKRTTFSLRGFSDGNCPFAGL